MPPPGTARLRLWRAGGGFQVKPEVTYKVTVQGVDRCGSSDAGSENRPYVERGKGSNTAYRQRAADAGVLIAMGTDSGAFPERFEGDFEHLEMEMMAEAGKP